MALTKHTAAVIIVVMGERISGAERAREHRFNDFVVRHARQALRWEMVEERSGVPIKFIEFSTTDKDDQPVAATSPSVSNHAMNLWLGLSKDERRKRGLVSAAIILESHEEDGVLSIADDCDQLPHLLGYGRSGAQPGPQAVDMLLDKMQGLEDSGLLIPAGKRTFSLDGNTISSIKSLEE